MDNFENAIREGNVEKVALLIKDKRCDVNQNIEHESDEDLDEIKERPLSVSTRNIKSENDKWFKISQLLLQHKSIDVNAECGSISKYAKTTLGMLCDVKCETTLGVRMLLKDSRADVNKGSHSPLYCALRNYDG